MQQMELLQQYLEAALAEEGLPSLREDCGAFKLGLSTVLTCECECLGFRCSTPQPTNQQVGPPGLNHEGAEIAVVEIVVVVEIEHQSSSAGINL